MVSKLRARQTVFVRNVPFDATADDLKEAGHGHDTPFSTGNVGAPSSRGKHHCTWVSLSEISQARCSEDLAE